MNAIKHGNPEAGWYVRLVDDDTGYDEEAGPFDDELDALEMGERALDIAGDKYVRRR